MSVCDPVSKANCQSVSNNGGAAVFIIPAPAQAGVVQSVNGSASVTGTGSTQLIAAVTAKKIFLLGWACSNSGATAVTVTFQDGSSGAGISGIIEVPAGGGNNMSPGGLSWGNTSAGNGLYFAASAGTTTLTCGAVGSTHNEAISRFGPCRIVSRILRSSGGRYDPVRWRGGFGFPV